MTRFGVSINPSRVGSSPIHFIRVRTACSASDRVGGVFVLALLGELLELMWSSGDTIYSSLLLLVGSFNFAYKVS